MQGLVDFDFGGAVVNQVILRPSSNSFEVDNFAGAIAAAPEQATWAMMIMGFGSAGRRSAPREGPHIERTSRALCLWQGVLLIQTTDVDDSARAGQ